MDLQTFISASASATSEKENEAIVSAYYDTYRHATKLEKEVILEGVAAKVEEITTRLVAEKLQNTVVSVKEYCSTRQVSRQYVYQEIKKGKFKTIELPIFTEYNGKKVAVGTKKFLAF